MYKVITRNGKDFKEHAFPRKLFGVRPLLSIMSVFMS